MWLCHRKVILSYPCKTHRIIMLSNSKQCPVLCICTIEYQTSQDQCFNVLCRSLSPSLSLSLSMSLPLSLSLSLSLFLSLSPCPYPLPLSLSPFFWNQTIPSQESLFGYRNHIVVSSQYSSTMSYLLKSYICIEQPWHFFKRKHRLYCMHESKHTCTSS